MGNMRAPSAFPKFKSYGSVVLMLATVAVVTALSLAVVTRPRDGKWEGFDAAGDAVPAGSEDSVAVVHAKWCGHCRELLKPGGVWERAKASLPTVKFVEIDEAEHGDLVKTLGITSFPDIRRMGVGGKSLAKFEGDRTAENLVTFAKEGL
jgi:thiol-disulfide isomerase/thioredoxin